MWELLILVVLLIVAVGTYNNLARLRQGADAAWADIDAQLGRRHDLVPSLVETVEGYADHEKEILERVVQARSSAMSVQGPAAKADAENILSGALESLFALSESYPQLQAAGGFRDLQATLSGIEEHLAQARHAYNAVVHDYNMRARAFPTVLVARSFGFGEREFFETPDAQQAVPRGRLRRGRLGRGR